MKIKQLSLIEDFKCIKERCPDNCCSEWTINISEEKQEQWLECSGELLNYTEINPYRNDNSIRMKLKNEPEQSCIMLESGLCNMHKKYGKEFLPEDCNIFPFVYKSLKNEIVTATMACPVIAKLVVENNGNNCGSWTFTDIDGSTIPNIIKNQDDISTLNSKIDFEYIQVVYRKVIKIIDTAGSADSAVAMLLLLAERFYSSLYEFNSASLMGCFPLAMYEYGRIKQLDSDVDTNSYIYTMLELLNRVVTRNRPVFNSVFENLENIIAGDCCVFYKNFEYWVSSEQEKYSSILKNFLKAKISEIVFPFAGTCDNIIEDTNIIASEYLLFKFLLISECHNEFNVDRITELCHAVDREFYSKKKSLLMEHLSFLGLDNRENLVRLNNNIIYGVLPE